MDTKNPTPTLADLHESVVCGQIGMQNAIDWAYLLGQTSAEKQGQ